MSLFMTGVTLNFAQIPLSSSSSPLHKPSSRYIPSAHCCRVYVFASRNSSPGSSCGSVHCVWVVCQSLRHPSPSFWHRCCPSSVCSQPCLHVNVILLTVYGSLLPLIVRLWSVEFQYFLV